MNHDKDPKLGTEPKQDETVFLGRMIGIVPKPGPLICEYSNGLVKGNTMLALVVPLLAIIPRKLYFIHIANILPISCYCKKEIVNRTTGCGAARHESSYEQGPSLVSS